MRRTKLIALLLVAVMAVATIPAMTTARETKPAPAALSKSVVGASITPTLSATASPRWPLRGEGYIVYGYLRDGNTPLTNKPILVLWKYPGETTYRYWKTVYTDANGKYTIGDAESAQRYVQYAFKYPGEGTTYNYALTYFTVWNGFTTTSISYSNIYPPGLIVEGFVRDGYGTGISLGFSVKLYYRSYNTATQSWSGLIYLTTLPNAGQGNFGYMPQQSSSRQYLAIFQGYPYQTVPYWSSASQTITVPWP